MPLPELIEIVPLTGPVRAEITVPGSKSITNRALILAALADGETTLQGALWSEDTQVMVDCLQKLGFTVAVSPDPNEFCNRTIKVIGSGGKIPNAGTAEQPLELFVGNAGTAARFLSALVCLGRGAYRLSGVARMHERPQAALFKALRELGYRVDSANDKLPATIIGSEPYIASVNRGSSPLIPKYEGMLVLPPAGDKIRSCTVNIEESSQFASALLLSADAGRWKIEVVGENAEESSYVAMTSKLIKMFPKKGGVVAVEPDASSGSYFLAAGTISEPVKCMEYSEQFGTEVPTTIFNAINVTDWPNTGLQADERFQKFLHFGDWMHAWSGPKQADLPAIEKFITEQIKKFEDLTENAEISRQWDLGDSIMTAIVIASVTGTTVNPTKSVKFIDLGRLRLQETERVFALKTELTKCGAKVVEEGDTLTVYPSELHCAEIETYDDHRMAMCFAVLGLKVPGIKLRNPACVKKTFPNFFQKLAAAPPHGLGVTILDAKTGRKLNEAELFAE